MKPLPDKPGMIITGATGFLGGRLIHNCCHSHRIFAIARHTLSEANMPEDTDIHYFPCDVSRFDDLRQVYNRIREMGGAEICLHLAGFYDFTGENHPEYETTNVIGTRNVLELSEQLHLKKLLFASSIAACPFPPAGGAITEDTPPTAPPPYSISKRKGEELLAQYRARVPSVILRLAAIFSNWCEYEPLYNFVEQWLGGGWDARILGGRGDWAVPYLHVRDLLPFMLTVIQKADELESLEVLQASPNGCTTMRELYEQAVRCHYGSPRRWLYVPKPLARLGIGMRLALGRALGNPPFERPWMGEYIDLRLNVDATRTHRRLGWRPSPELAINACMPAMIHNRRTHPHEWRKRYHHARKGRHVHRNLRMIDEGRA